MSLYEGRECPTCDGPTELKGQNCRQCETIATIKEQMNNALEGGYIFEDWTAAEIAADLIAYSVNFEDWDIDKLTPLVAKATEKNNVR